ncbi:hypothetical protein CYMTET_42720, partial [Cymbomonas tetramitiformis]
MATVEDLIHLRDSEGQNNEKLNESIVHNLSERFKEDKYYTHVGPVLISINPYKWMPDLYSEQRMRRYFRTPLGDAPPHIYAVADSAYRWMLRDRRAQAIVISGESGAGKTEAAKLIMNYIFKAAAMDRRSERSDYDIDELSERILATGVVLEAFGNSKTVRNDNSSRFGKYTELQFDYEGQPIGASIRHYLLERMRVVQQAPGERSYHIFYQMLAAVKDPELVKQLGLLPPKQYRYLYYGEVNVEGVDDEVRWRDTLQGLSKMGFSPKEISQ